jgi:hypothetical protein
MKTTTHLFHYKEAVSFVDASTTVVHEDAPVEVSGVCHGRIILGQRIKGGEDVH